MVSGTLLNEIGQTIFVLLSLSGILAGILFVWLAAKILKFKKHDLKTALVVSIVIMITTIIFFGILYLLLSIVNVILPLNLLIEFFLGIIVATPLIMHFYKVNWIDAVKASILILALWCLTMWFLLVIVVPRAIMTFWPQIISEVYGIQYEV